MKMRETKKTGAQHVYPILQKKGFLLHHQGLPLPPVAFPGVPVSLSVSWCPGVPVRVPSLPLPFVASPEMLKNRRFFDGFKSKRVKIQRFSQLLNTNV